MGGGLVREERGRQMLKLKHSRGNMGLSLARSLQELATRTETSKQAVVSLVSFIKGGGAQRRLRRAQARRHALTPERSSGRLWPSCLC